MKTTMMTLAVLVVLTRQSCAGVILQDTSNDSYCFCSQNIAQTFTAEDANIQSIAFRIGDLNPHLGVELRFTAILFEGSGFGGTYLGDDTRSFASLADVSNNSSEIPEFQDFDFSEVLLTVGNTYTVLIHGRTGRNDRGGVRIQSAEDSYPGGDFLIGGSVVAGWDMAFRVTPIPEPSTLTLAAFALLGIAYGRRKGR